MSNKKKTFVIVDALAIAYKAYFAFVSRPLKTKTGIPTSAVYGFVNQLIKLLEDLRPDFIGVAFDSKEKTFRHEMYEKYKSTRAVIPDDLIPQIEKIKEVISAMNIPVLIAPGFEADDIVGTAVKLATENNLQSFMITPDKDYIQLINENVNLIRPGKGNEDLEIIDFKKAAEEIGFPPELMIDYLALVGDPSDDIPGVKGIGPVTANPLIAEFGTIENIYANIGKISKKATVTKLEVNKENAFLSKKLATIHLQVPIEIDFDKLELTPPNLEELQRIFTELEFKNQYIRIRKLFAEKEEAVAISETQSESERYNSSKTNYKLIADEKEAKALAAKLMNVEKFVFDTETNSLDHFTTKLAGVSFSFKENEAYFVAINPFEEADGLFGRALHDRLHLQKFVEIFSPVFKNKNSKKICQNGKFDISILRSCGIEINNFYFDTMVASYVINPDQKHGMDDLAEYYLNYKPIPLSDLIGEKKDAERIFDVDLNSLSNYSCEDADVTLKLFNVLSEKIEKENLQKIAYEVDFPLVTVLEDMEREGIRIDRKILSELSAELEKMMNRFSENIFFHAGENFNINSPQQLQVILYDKLKLTKGRKTKTGYSTDARALESLKGEHQIIDLILDYRQVAKLKSTYTDALPQLIHPSTGRVHTSFAQTVASTGRLASNDPNLQNIPIRTDLGKEIRKAFVPRDSNHVILSADYSQIELRIMASICGDETLSKAFINGEDIHRSTAALVFQVAIEEVTPDMRRKAKEVNFGILYGIGAFGLKNRLGISQTHAKEVIDTYFTNFSKVKKFMDDSIEAAKEKGYAETLLGRRRFLQNINSKNFVVRQFEERVAINMPIQGTAADMIKLAMINIHNHFKQKKYKSKMVLQVHDELVFDVHKDEIDEVKSEVKRLMETALPLNVPVVVDSGIGDNWLDAH